MNALSNKRVWGALLTGIFAFIALASWAISSPVGASPDEDYHLVSIWCSWGEREALCSAGENPGERIVSERLADSSSCFLHKPTKSAQCQLDDLKMKSYDRGNFYGEYPPIFYSVMGLFAGTDIAHSVLLMRLVNSVLFVVLSFFVVLLMPVGNRGPIIWGGLATFVPLGIFLVTSVNPSGWAIQVGLLLWASLWGYLSTEKTLHRISLGIISLLLAFMGAGARGDSAVYVALAAIFALVLTIQKNKSWLRLSLLPLFLFFVGIYFFLTTGQGTGAATATASQSLMGATATVSGGQQANSDSIGLLLSNLMDLPWLWTGGTGTWGLGWLDTHPPKAVWVLMIGVISALVFWGIRVMTTRKALLMLVTLAVMTAVPLYVLQGKGVRVGEFVQPRYLLPLLIIFVCISLYGFTNDNLGIRRLQAGIIFAAIAISNSLALHTNLRRYVTGMGDGGFNLNQNIEWWWATQITPMLVWSIGSIGFGLLLVCIWHLLYPRKSKMNQRSTHWQMLSS